MRSLVIFDVDCNAPETIIEAMLDIFDEMVYQCLIIYIDDIITHARTSEEYVKDLKRVLQ